MAHPALDNPSCQSMAARIPAACMQSISELMVFAQSVSENMCDDSATRPLFGPSGMAMRAVRCLLDVPELADLAPFSNVLSRATLRRIFCFSSEAPPSATPGVVSAGGPGVQEFTETAYAVLLSVYAIFLLGKRLSRCEFE